MRVSHLLSFCFRSLFRNRMRSLLTSLGIIIGVGSVIVMVAVGDGSQAQISRQIASMGTNLLMVRAPRGPREANRLSQADIAKLRREATLIRAISGETEGSFDVVGGSGSWSTTVRGVEPDYLVIKEWTVAEGALFTDQDSLSRTKVAVLGKTVAQKLFPDANPLGQSVRIGTTPFTVIGVLAEKGSSAMGTDQDDAILVPLGTAVTRLSRDRYLGGISLTVVAPAYMSAAEKEVESLLRESHRLSTGTDNDFDIMNQASIIKTASATTQTLTTLLAAIAGVSLVVGGIGIMNIMLVSVTERTREIGIRMAVGARRKDILLQFLTEAVVLSLAGGAVGIVTAVTLCWGLTALGGIPTLVSPVMIVLSAGFSGVVGVFFGYYPARKASSLRPIEALRHE